MEKLYYSISEVAEQLGENVSAVRFWSNYFEKFIRPARNAKGNRQYRSDDIAILKEVRYLVKDKGLTLEGAARQLSSERSGIDKSLRVLESLKSIRGRLVEVKEIL